MLVNSTVLVVYVAQSISEKATGERNSSPLSNQPWYFVRELRDLQKFRAERTFFSHRRVTHTHTRFPRKPCVHLKCNVAPPSHGRVRPAPECNDSQLDWQMLSVIEGLVHWLSDAISFMCAPIQKCLNFGKHKPRTSVRWPATQTLHAQFEFAVQATPNTHHRKLPPPSKNQSNHVFFRLMNSQKFRTWSHTNNSAKIPMPTEFRRRATLTRADLQVLWISYHQDASLITAWHCPTLQSSFLTGSSPCSESVCRTEIDWSLSRVHHIKMRCLSLALVLSVNNVD